jgi:hypothetical protein
MAGNLNQPCPSCGRCPTCGGIDPRYVRLEPPYAPWKILPYEGPIPSLSPDSFTICASDDVIHDGHGDDGDLLAGP